MLLFYFWFFFSLKWRLLDFCGYNFDYNIYIDLCLVRNKLVGYRVKEVEFIDYSFFGYFNVLFDKFIFDSNFCKGSCEFFVYGV